MLYERWQEIARNHAREVAVRDLLPGRTLTFEQLAQLVDAAPEPGDAVVFPRGHGWEFVRSVLAAWRHGRVVCPLDVGQPTPVLDSLPAGCMHLKSTSATTGPARMIAFREEQLFADAQNIVSTMGLRCEWPNLAVISLAHSYGFSNLVLPLVLFGIPLVLASPPLPETLRAVAKLLDEFSLPAVPALWQAWHQAGALSANIRIAISAGAPLPLSLEAQVFESNGLKIHNFYGSSECGGIAYDRTDTPRSDGAVAGKALNNVQLGINPDGLLEVSGAAVAETYWPEADARLGQGWFVTSDLADIKDGEVSLRGRATDLMNIAGRKVSPDLIERELLRHEAVQDCVVFGTSDAVSGRGECIAACVVAAGIAEQELRDFLLGKLASWQVPRIWHFMDALPRNDRGKISRAELRRKFTQ